VVDPREHADGAPTRDYVAAHADTPAGEVTVPSAGGTEPGSTVVPDPGRLPPAPAAPVASPGSLVLPCTFGDYELLEELGRGGMGVVYKARQYSLGRLVALKMVAEHARASEQVGQRLGLEARAAAALDHPNIVPVFDAGRHEGYQYFTMAYVEGSTLAARAAGRGLPVAEAVRVVRVVAEAVENVHRHGIVHRDLKPSNVLIDREGRPRVTDFGLAKSVAGGAGLTGTGQIVGTPSYMAPEQAYGKARGEVGPAADVYALGGLLYYTLTGSPPFSGDSLPEILLRVVHEPPTPIRWSRPLVPAELEAICLKCLSKDPAQRYPSAGALADALRAWESRPAEQLPPVDFALGPPPQPATPGPRRAHRPLIVAAALLAAACLALLAYRLWPAPQADTSWDSDGAPEAARQWDVLGDAGKPPRRDFDLRVRALGGRRGGGGELLLDEGTVIALEITVARDANVKLTTVDPNGVVVDLFPNEYEPDAHFIAGRPRVLPGKVEKPWVLKAKNLSPGVEHFVIGASTKDLVPPKGGEKVGQFRVFHNDEDRADWRGNWDEQFRGVVFEPAPLAAEAAKAPPSASEMTIPYRVVPAGR
jgi:predicted Ser/Thr protein kinase